MSKVKDQTTSNRFRQELVEFETNLAISQPPIVNKTINIYNLVNN